MIALFCMSNPLWEWIIAPMALMSLGWWGRELLDDWLNEED